MVEIFRLSIPIVEEVFISEMASCEGMIEIEMILVKSGIDPTHQGFAVAIVISDKSQGFYPAIQVNIGVAKNIILIY